jgi:hypothetical protein
LYGVLLVSCVTVGYVRTLSLLSTTQVDMVVHPEGSGGAATGTFVNTSTRSCPPQICAASPTQEVLHSLSVEAGAASAGL